MKHDGYPNIEQAIIMPQSKPIPIKASFWHASNL